MLNDFQAECPKCGNYAVFIETKDSIVFRCAECRELVEWPEQVDDDPDWSDPDADDDFLGTFYVYRHDNL